MVGFVGNLNFVLINGGVVCLPPAVEGANSGEGAEGERGRKKQIEERKEWSEGLVGVSANPSPIS